MPFYDPQKGEIKIDEKNLKDITRHSLRDNYGMVLQETWLKETSIKENVKMGKEDATLIMAHGTPHPGNAYYSVIQDRIEKLGMNNVFVYSVEGRPNLDDVIPKLKAKGFKNVTLMPIMMVAGDHANNDMAGDEPDSHKSILTKAGFKVNTYIHGLGENENVRALYIQRANEALAAFQK